MDELLRLLAVKEAAPLGVLLACLFVFGLGFRFGWWVEGGRYRDKTDALKISEESNGTMRLELDRVRLDYERLRIEKDMLWYQERRPETSRSRTRKRSEAVT